MGLELSLDENQKLIADEVDRFCRDCCDADTLKSLVGQFPDTQWRGLGELGFLALGAPDGEGGARELVAAMQPLGRAVFPGPLVDTVLALQVATADEREGLIAGRLVASSGHQGLFPFAQRADLFFVVEGGHVYRAQARSMEPVSTLGGEPWGRVVLDRGERCEHGTRALVLSDIALSAYLTGAAQGLLGVCAEHVATRKQFGRSIGGFQAVAHPLADCHMALGAAEQLARAAACAFDEEGRDARGLSAAARWSSVQAALGTAYTCHQKFGAIGITLEGPAHHVTRRIRQLASRPPSSEVPGEAVLAHFGV